jgi:hypothetical protein
MTGPRIAGTENMTSAKKIKGCGPLFKTRSAYTQKPGGEILKNTTLLSWKSTIFAGMCMYI